MLSDRSLCLPPLCIRTAVCSKVSRGVISSSSPLRDFLNLQIALWSTISVTSGPDPLDQIWLKFNLDSDFRRASGLPSPLDKRVRQRDPRDEPVVGVAGVTGDVGVIEGVKGPEVEGVGVIVLIEAADGEDSGSVGAVAIRGRPRLVRIDGVGVVLPRDRAASTSGRLVALASPVIVGLGGGGLGEQKSRSGSVIAVDLIARIRRPSLKRVALSSAPLEERVDVCPKRERSDCERKSLPSVFHGLHRVTTDRISGLGTVTLPVSLDFCEWLGMMVSGLWNRVGIR